MRLLIPILIASTLHASPWRKLYRASIAAVAAASIADVSTSLGPGKGESNPLLASSNGRFGVRGIEIKSAIVAGSLIGGWIVTRRHSPKPAAISNFGMAGVYGAIALHNSRLR
jgi:hypothetical protein